VADDQVRRALLRHGFALGYAPLAWNMAGIVVLALAAFSARSVALAGFALDSLIEIGRPPDEAVFAKSSSPNRRFRSLPR
jgi:hypothetical protein